MTRTIPSALATALAQSPRKGAECAVIESAGGIRLGLTTWNRALTIDLNTGEGEESCEPGLIHSAITLATGMDASHCEISGPIGGEMTRARVLGGYWRNASVWLGWTSPGVATPLPIVPILYGTVAECRLEDSLWIFEVRNKADAFNQSIGRVLSPYCPHDYGDALCTQSREPYPCEVTAVTNSFQFTVDATGHPDSFFDYGEVAFLTGELAGIIGEVFQYSAGALELFATLPVAPQVGDTLNLFRGCSNLRKSDDPTVPTCLTYGNVINFGGHPDVPGTEKYLKIASPGSGSAESRFSGGTLNGGGGGGLTPSI